MFNLILNIRRKDRASQEQISRENFKDDIMKRMLRYCTSLFSLPANRRLSFRFFRWPHDLIRTQAHIRLFFFFYKEVY